MANMKPANCCLCWITTLNNKTVLSDFSQNCDLNMPFPQYWHSFTTHNLGATTHFQNPPIILHAICSVYTYHHIIYKYVLVYKVISIVTFLHLIHRVFLKPRNPMNRHGDPVTWGASTVALAKRQRLASTAKRRSWGYHQRSLPKQDQS